MYVIKSRGENIMEQIEKIERKDRNYRIDIGAYGSIGIEAPTKEECLELFQEVTSTKRKQSIDEAIR
jgi:NTP pyrophosphatase (non-canonical NTP hydrolase)